MPQLMDATIASTSVTRKRCLKSRSTTRLLHTDDNKDVV